MIGMKAVYLKTRNSNLQKRRLKILLLSSKKRRKQLLTPTNKKSFPPKVRDLDTETRALKYYTHLCSIMLKTSRSRFHAASMLTSKERVSLIVSLVLSIFLISASIVQLASIFDLTDAQNKKLSVLSIVAAIGVLVQTVFDFSLGRSILATKLHDNALSVTRLLRELERILIEMPFDRIKASELADKYEEMNIITSANHSSLDFYLSSRPESSFGPLANFILGLWKMFVKILLIILSSFFGVATSVFILIGVLGL
ncbi:MULTISPECIES: SLATT domain-containing protein [unclassified Sulfitobacter]|uniref:SLATT domain-containing protein n=2 Tax=Sulfitobacter TaxID=60136 RepID=UPI00374781E7